MLPSPRHGRLKHLFATLVELIAAERGFDVEGVGSTTFRRAVAQESAVLGNIHLGALTTLIQTGQTLHRGAWLAAIRQALARGPRTQ